MASFSGGWKMRIGLGKILLTEPNILLLDEPTNHLDLESLEWMERFLTNQRIPMVIVSHDREFLDRVCTKVPRRRPPPPPFPPLNAVPPAPPTPSTPSSGAAA